MTVYRKEVWGKEYRVFGRNTTVVRQHIPPDGGWESYISDCELEPDWQWYAVATDVATPRRDEAERGRFIYAGGSPGTAMELSGGIHHPFRRRATDFPKRDSVFRLDKHNHDTYKQLVE